MSIKDKGNITLAMKQTGGMPEGVSFDGVTDYLSRSSDLVGNTDSKTFTFSCWVYNGEISKTVWLYKAMYRFAIYVGGGTLVIDSYNTADSQICSGSLGGIIPQNTYINIIISVDLTNTANRFVVVNDKIVNFTWNYYVNDYIDFTSATTAYYISANAGTAGGRNRLSHCYLDYTYRDLSIVANRRLFITADGKPTDPSVLQALNPILYLPMKDKATAHINLGTGGDFVQNGLIETADRGANQDNCVMSKFDGVGDYLSNALIAGLADSYTATISFNVTVDTTYYLRVFTLQNTENSTNYPRMQVYQNSPTDYLWIVIEDSTGINVTIKTQPLVIGKTYSFNIAIDTRDSLKTIVHKNGLIETLVSNTVSNRTIQYSGFSTSHIGADYQYYSGAYTGGSIGELYFDTNYIDLSVNNPFWDSDTNKPIPVRKVMQNLGSNPLICMPIEADNPTKNYGSGGDFTLNGGGLVGARGMSEYIARSISAVDNTYSALQSGTFTQTIQYNSISGCLSLFIKSTEIANATQEQFMVLESTDGYLIGLVYSYTSGNNYITVTSTTPSFFSGSFNINLDVWTTILFSFTGGVWVNSNNIVSSLYSNNKVYNYTKLITKPTNAKITYSNYTIFNQNIDFSQEANRNLFVSQLGYPRDLKPLIADGTIPTPLVYLPFDDPSNLGKNLGTAGDFTVNGTVTPGADFTL